MIGRIKGIVVTLVLFLAFSSCIDEISGVVEGYEELLVIEALVSNEDVPYEVYLSLTSDDINVNGDAVTGATVNVEDEEGNVYLFEEVKNGTYQSDDDVFRGQVNMKYRLNINIKNGNTYQSEWCKLNEPGEIDTIYYDSFSYYDTSDRKNRNGISFFVDGRSCAGNEVSLRWKCFHDWKFMVQYPTGWQLFPEYPDSAEYVDEQYKYCFKSSVSTNVNIYSFLNTKTKEIKKQNIINMTSAHNDMFSIRHSMLVKQYSISTDEYNFWRNIKETTQETGDIFGKQPYSVISNIQNLTDPTKRAVGFFKVAGVTSKRIYINRSDIARLRVSAENYVNQCDVDTGIIDYVEYGNLYQVYDHFVNGMGKGLVSVLMDDFTYEKFGITFTKKQCNDCRVTGRATPPSFWIEEDETEN